MKLERCPFCPPLFSSPEIIQKRIEANGFDVEAYRVRCATCHAQSPYKRNAWLHGWHTTKEEAAEAWNRRSEGGLILSG